MTSASVKSLREAIHQARRLHQSGAGTVLDALLRLMPSVDIDELGARMETEAGVSVVADARDHEPDWGILDRSLARQHRAVMLKSASSSTVLAMADPWHGEAVKALSKLLGTLPRLAATSAAALRDWSGENEEAGGSPDIGRGALLASIAQGSDKLNGLVVDFVDTAINAAYVAGASDIHFECNRQGVSVKFRQDGVLMQFSDMQNLQKAQEVISRIKVLAQLDITERRIPQDGRFRFDTGHGSIDLRVSIMPSVFGEDAVLRLLDKAQLRARDASITLDLLGFNADNIDRIRELADLPHGMLLVTGPTGSGKTTTVYAMLSEINNGQEKIITIEDPVEYELPGVLQIPVNERKGLTFAKGLRSILRHDPDRILVGEIRDAETAEIAIQSALTGHQVFTTVHANSIFDVTGRFRHFGLDVFGFMSSLNGVIVQRLVRKLCPHCAHRRQPTDKEDRWLKRHGQSNILEVPTPRGCEHCHGGGFIGRLVLAEVHCIDDRFRDLVLSNAPVSALREHVKASGASSLDLQATGMVARGVTSPEEIKRVVGWL